MGRKFCNKLWNASRFVLLQMQNSPKESLRLPAGQAKFEVKNLTKADKRVLKALDKIIKSINKDLESFQFGPATRRLYDFFWHDFCDIYIEKSKFQKDRKNTQKVLLHVLSASLKLLHPFVPFITEEIYQKLPMKNKKKCLMIEELPSSLASAKASAVESWPR